MTTRTLTKQARTLIDNQGNISVASAQEREKVAVDIEMPNGSIKRVFVLVSPGQIINQKKLRRRVIAGQYTPSVSEK